VKTGNEESAGSPGEAASVSGCAGASGVRLRRTSVQRTKNAHRAMREDIVTSLGIVVRP
jgi:hypothetical protein